MFTRASISRVLTVLLASGLLISVLVLSVTAQDAPLISAVETSEQSSSQPYASMTPPVNQPTPDPVVITRLEPNQSLANVPNEVRVFGANLQPSLHIMIGGVDLRNVTVGRTDGTELTAIVPAGIAPGLYDVVAEMSNQLVYTLTAGYTVINPGGLDLAVNDYDLWFFPQGVRLDRETEIGLNVHRSGGSDVVTPTVRFYLENPITGTLLGEAVTPPLDPGTNVVGTAMITWTPPITGTFAVYAVVDPANVISETSETNNTASVAVLVRLPEHQYADDTEPILNHLTIQNRFQVTTMPTVTMALTATDNEGGSGLAFMYMMEHTYSNAARQWVVRQQTGWIPYTSTHPFVLSPGGGVRYLQAWVGDAAGNITRTATRTQINYMQTAENMLQGQVHLYRYELMANQTLQARLTITQGDADLYIWDAQGNRVAYSNNEGTAIDTAQVTSTQGGTYQVEVHAYADCVYNLDLSTTGGVLAAAQSATNAKDLPTEPVVAVTNEPADQQALSTVPLSTAQNLYLPVTLR